MTASRPPKIDNGFASSWQWMKDNRVALGGGILFLVMIGIYDTAQKRHEQAVASAQVAPDVETDPNALGGSAWREGRRLSGEACLSPMEGSNWSLVTQVQERLRDPDSFAHRQTWVRPIGKDGRNWIKMTFGSANGYGGMGIGEAIGSVDPDSCEATLTKMTQLQ